MITVKGGSLYQWERDQVVITDSDTPDTMHIAHLDAHAACDVSIQNMQACIPDELLVCPGMIGFWAVNTQNGVEVIDELVMRINRRQKPDGYGR